MRTGVFWTALRSVVAAQHGPAVVAMRVAVAIGARTPVARTGDIAVAVGTAVAAPARHRRLVIGRLRGPGARTGVGRTLVDIVVLGGRLGETRGGIAITATAGAAAI